MAVTVSAGARNAAVDEVRERYRLAEQAESGRDRSRYLDALRAFLATAEHHASALSDDGREVAPLLDEAAMAFYRASDPELAERAVDLGLRLTPGASTLLHHKALVLLALNRDLPEVVRLVDRALEANPHERGLWATRGDALRLLGRPDDAADAYLKAQELEPTSTEYVDRALKVAPHHPRALRTKVDLARARGGDLHALAAADELLGRSPDDADLRLSRAELLCSLGRREEALQAVRQLPTPPPVAARRLEARLLFDLGRANDAIPIAQALIEGPEALEPPALEEIAKAAARHKPELALSARQRLASVDPRNVQNLLDLRSIALTLGRRDVALEACRAVLAAEPENLEAMRGVAEAQSASGNTAEALAAYRVLAERHPRAVGELHKALAMARSASKAEDVAFFAEAILAAEPTDADARAELARSLADSGDTAGALEQYDQILKLHPGDLGVLLAKRDLLATAGDRERLAPVLDELFHLDPTRTDVAVQRGNLYLSNAYDLPERSSERLEAARAALVSYERASSSAEAADPSLLGIARASRLVDDHDRAIDAYGRFLAREENHERFDVHKERAHALREAGRFPEAVEEYKRAINGGLEDSDLLWGTAEAYARLGEIATAVRLLDILLKREPDEAVFLRRKGQLLLSSGRREEALTVLQRAVHGADRDPQAYLEVAEALRAQGAYADAISYYQQGLAIDPKHRHGRLALAETLLLAGRYSDVLGLVDPLLKEDPNDLAAWKARADAWRALGRPTEVLYSLEAILLLDPESAPTLIETYRLRRERGETRAAYDALDRLVRLGGPEGKDATVYLELGDLASALGEPDTANAAYERAATLDPSIRGEIAVRRARLRLAAGRPDLALEVLDSTLAHAGPAESPNVAAVLLRAELLATLERPSEARTAYEEVRKRDPSSPVAAAGIARSMIAEARHADAAAFLEAALPQLAADEGTFLLLAEAESGLGQLDRAYAGLMKGLAALPKSVALWIRLGEVSIARQAWPDAANAFAHALALTPGSVDLLLRAGFVAERLGHPNEALAFYERATEAGPTQPQVWVSRGLALLATGRPTDATASFERALSLDSDFAPAKEGKKLANQRTRDAEVQKYGREALLLEARLNRPVTKNDLFVTLHVPYEFLTPVLREIGQVPKVDLAKLSPEEARDLDTASYQVITAALEHRPPGIERRGFTLADVAVLSAPAATLEQTQKLFGYLRAVLEAEIKPEQIALPPDVEELARKALTLPPEGRTLFQLVRTMHVGVYKARLIKAVEEAGAASGSRPPALDLGAYSPEFRAPPAPASPAAPAPAGPVPAPPAREPVSEAPHAAAASSAPASVPAAAAVPSEPVVGPTGAAATDRPVHAKHGDRCVGCGGLASVVHDCGAPLCASCVSHFSKCPKCGETLVPGSTRPIPGPAPAPPASEKAAPPGHGLGALKGVFRRSARAAEEPPSAPSPLPHSEHRRATHSLHLHPRESAPAPKHEPEARPPPAAAPAKKPAPAEPAKAGNEPKATPATGPDAGAGAEPGSGDEAANPPKRPRPAKGDDEPRL